MLENIDLPLLMRKAREAVANQSYVEAESIYALIMLHDEMKHNLDLQMRHAFCAEKAGKIEVALKYYQEIVITYHEQGEVGAAEIIEQKIADLYAATEAGIVTDVSEVQDETQAIQITPLTDDELMAELVNMGERHALYPTEVLCHADDPAEHVWLVEQGVIDVHMPDMQKNRLEVKQGSLLILGELGLFTKERRNATLIADSSVSYIAISFARIRSRQQKDAAFALAMERLLRERWVEPVLKQHSVFERINDFDRRHLANAFERITLNAGESLITAGVEYGGAFILQSGCMFLTYDESHEGEEDEHLMTGVHPSDLIHLGGLLRGYKSNYNIAAATSVELLYLSRENFERFSLKRPWIIQAILRYSRRPAHLQVMHPQDQYLWQANRDIKFRRAC